MKIYITYFSLSRGILEIEKTKSNFWGYKGYVELDTPINNACRVPEKFCHNKIEDAIKQANLMRANKIKQLESEIEKIKNIDFNLTKD